ncbi:hypothetical protein JNJ66_00260 [Candidatus Saccharibacteria bacterium]|nr:hypothetical protein [Candidatus Saccharibacteria bacterium]
MRQNKLFYTTALSNIIFLPLALLLLYEFAGPGLLNGIWGGSAVAPWRIVFGNILIGLLPIVGLAAALIVSWLGFTAIHGQKTSKVRLAGVVVTGCIAIFVDLLILFWRSLTT